VGVIVDVANSSSHLRTGKTFEFNAAKSRFPIVRFDEACHEMGQRRFARSTGPAYCDDRTLIPRRVHVPEHRLTVARNANVTQLNVAPEIEHSRFRRVVHGPWPRDQGIEALERRSTALNAEQRT
jgi:hypothetical protein